MSPIFQRNKQELWSPLLSVYYKASHIILTNICSLSELSILMIDHPDGHASTVRIVEFLLWYASSRWDRSCTMSRNTTESMLSPSTYNSIQSPSFDRRTMFPMACRLISRNRIQNRYTLIRGDTIMMNLNKPIVNIFWEKNFNLKIF